MEKKISKASLGRVSRYLTYLNKLDASVTNISSTTISKALNLGEVQVRKDLALLCGSGKPKIGYEKEHLIETLSSYFEDDNGKTIIIGVGKLGSALLDYKGFEEYGIDVLAGFDIKPDNAKTLKKSIYPMSDLKKFVKENNVRIAIITVNESGAQEAFDKAYSSGIRLFASFAPCLLEVPKDAVVHYENVALLLAHLKTIDVKKQD